MLEIFRKRRSVRSYLEKAIEDDKITEILKAVMFSPTARGLRPWEFIIVKDSVHKKRLSQATPYASFAKYAPIIINAIIVGIRTAKICVIIGITILISLEFDSVSSFKRK